MYGQEGMESLSQFYIKPNKLNQQSIFIQSYLVQLMNKVGFSIILALVAAAGIYLSQTQEAKLSQFQTWKVDFNIQFKSQLEEMYRERVFYQNLKTIINNNANPHRQFQMGVNQFTALTQQQFILTHLGTVVPNVLHLQVPDFNANPNVDIDWVQQGAVSPIKNQGQCSASWAFAVTGALQGLSKIAYGTLRRFSQQQLVDCSSSYGNRGCTGGFPGNGYKYVIEHGICSDDQYPYKGVVGTCKNCTNPFRISGVTDIKTCPQLEKAIQRGPVSVCVDATSWATYRSGVLSNCGTNINHAALLVGDINGVWKVKNSWGAAWGQNGYIRLAAGNTCGICNAATIPNK